MYKKGTMLEWSFKWIHWEGVKKETVTILTSLSHYGSRLRQIVGSPTFVLIWSILWLFCPSYPSSLPACDVHNIGSGNSLMYWSGTVWYIHSGESIGDWWWDSVVYIGIMMREHYFTKLESSGYIYIAGVGEVVNYKFTLTHKVITISIEDY